MKNLLMRLQYLFRQRRIEAELREEIEFHRSETQERFRQSGMTTGQAADAARRALGNVTLAYEDARAVSVAPWIDGLRQDVAYSFRVLRRAPGFGAAMILVMALGIGATTAVFGLLDALVLRDLPVVAPNRLVYFSRPAFSYPIFLAVRARATHVFSTVVAWDISRLNVAWNTQLEPAEVLTASGEYFSMLGIRAAIGRTVTPDDDRIGGGPEGLVAVISHAAWQRRFQGDPAVVGRALRIDRHTFTIVGVTPEGFFGVAPGLAPEITIPLTSIENADALAMASTSRVHLLARLRDGISVKAANAALRTFWPAVLEATTNPGMPVDRRAIYLGRTTELEPANAGYSRVRNQFRQPLWLLFGLVTVVLTVACASAANLILARGVARQREIAVRLAIGADRARLVRQLLTETVVWTALASTAGLFLAYWVANALVALMTTSQEPIALALPLDWRMLGFSIALALVTAVVCSMIPALRATRLDPGTSLKETGQITSPASGRWSLGKSLVAAQIALTVVLLFGAVLFVRSLDRVMQEDAGVDRDNILIAAIDAEAAGYEDERLALFFEQLLARFTNVAGVQSASLSMYPPISDEDGAWTQSIAIDGAPLPTTPGRSSVYFNSISPAYFQTVGIQLVRGRAFAATDNQAAPRVAIVNEALARRFFPDQNPVGRQITIGRNKNRQDLRIVGVVRNAKYQRLEEEPRAIAYLPWRQHPSGNLFAEIRVAAPLSVVAAGVTREVRTLDAIVPIRFETVTDRIRESLVTRRVIALLATALGVVALVLACAGVYGVLAYAVSGRTRELGLRLALGAERMTVLRMVIKESAILTVVGITAGAGTALLVAGVAKDLLYQIQPRDPMSLVAAGVIMLVVTSLAAFIPARRAARVDPVVALRCE